MMNPAIALLALVQAVSPAVLPSEFKLQPVSQTEREVVFIDVASLKRDVSRVSYWQLAVLKKQTPMAGTPGLVSHIFLKVETDCSNRTLKIGTALFYSDSKQRLIEGRSEKGNAGSFGPDDSPTFNFVCLDQIDPSNGRSPMDLDRAVMTVRLLFGGVFRGRPSISP